MKNIHSIWRATFLRRWHRNAYLASTVDTLAGHQGRVALLLLQYWPGSTAEAIHYALTHDLPESGVGDMCGEAKRNNPKLADELSKVEGATGKAMGLVWNVTAKEIRRVDFCDKMDAYLWMQHHQPSLVTTPDWLDARERLAMMADNLGVEVVG